MISGLKLSVRPNMSGVTLIEILADFNILHKTQSASHTCQNGTLIVKEVYTGKKYKTIFFSYSKPDDLGFVAISKLFRLISSAIPDFIQVNKYSNRILLVSYPKFQEWRDNDVFESLLDEIQRLALFLLSVYGSENESVVRELIEKYVNLILDIKNEKD